MPSNHRRATDRRHRIICHFLRPRRSFLRVRVDIMLVALQCLKTATLDGVYYASSLHPHLYLSHGFPYISTHFRVCCSTTERNIYLIELCLSVSSLKWLWWFCSMAANSLKKTSPPPVLWLFPPRLLTPFFSVNLCYPSMLNHCHLLYIYDNISSRVIETQSSTSKTQFERQSFRRLQLEQSIAESRWIELIISDETNKKTCNIFWTQPIPRPNNTLLNICSIKIQADSTLKNLLFLITLNSLSLCVCRSSVVWRHSCCISEYVSHYLAIIRCLPIVSLCEISTRDNTRVTVLFLTRN